MLATPSLLAMVRRSSFFPLKANDEVRPATFRLGIFTSALRSSSVRPSEKYSWSLSLLILVKGRTARELVSAMGAEPAVGAGAEAEGSPAAPGPVWRCVVSQR